MFLHITRADHIGGYKIEVSFSDGRKGVVDLSEIFDGQLFEPLKDVSQFSRFKVDEELETVVWHNGTDLAPEYLYFQAFKDDSTLQPQFKKWGYVTEVDNR